MVKKWWGGYWCSRCAPELPPALLRNKMTFLVAVLSVMCDHSGDTVYLLLALKKTEVKFPLVYFCLFLSLTASSRCSLMCPVTFCQTAVEYVTAGKCWCTHCNFRSRVNSVFTGWRRNVWAVMRIGCKLHLQQQEVNNQQVVNRTKKRKIKLAKDSVDHLFLAHTLRSASQLINTT